ncbi:hypothetical protein [Streptomyces pseudogriseolus]|uniref:hypothetical protein n=1 Tax=Streptomyces pseudogriseolus TaxID=36817 RepID=UPI003FA29C01
MQHHEFLARVRELGEYKSQDEAAAVGVGGAKPGVLEGLRLCLVQQQVLDSRPGVTVFREPAAGRAPRHEARPGQSSGET